MAEIISSDAEGDLKRIQSECATMLQYLGHLEKTEKKLAKENEILAREALTLGFDNSVLRTPPKRLRVASSPKRRKKEMSSSVPDESNLDRNDADDDAEDANPRPESEENLNSSPQHELDGDNLAEEEPDAPASDQASS